MEGRLAGWSMSITGIFLLFSSCLPSSLPLSLSLGPRGGPSAFPLPSDPSFTMTRAVQKGTQHSPSECQAAGTAVCEHSSIAHISSLQQEKQSKTPRSAFTWGWKCSLHQVKNFSCPGMTQTHTAAFLWSAWGNRLPSVNPSELTD